MPPNKIFWRVGRPRTGGEGRKKRKILTRDGQGKGKGGKEAAASVAGGGNKTGNRSTREQLVKAKGNPAHPRKGKKRRSKAPYRHSQSERETGKGRGIVTPVLDG